MKIIEAIRFLLSLFSGVEIVIDKEERKTDPPKPYTGPLVVGKSRTARMAELPMNIAAKRR
jgi:hypothetical protein